MAEAQHSAHSNCNEMDGCIVLEVLHQVLLERSIQLLKQISSTEITSTAALLLVALR